MLAIIAHTATSTARVRRNRPPEVNPSLSIVTVISVNILSYKARSVTSDKVVEVQPSAIGHIPIRQSQPSSLRPLNKPYKVRVDACLSAVQLQNTPTLAEKRTTSTGRTNPIPSITGTEDARSAIR